MSFYAIINKIFFNIKFMVSNKNPELNESIENKKNQNQDIKWKFIKEFSKVFLAWADKISFINEIMNSNSISDSKLIERKLKLFQSSSDDADIQNFDLSKINIFDLRRLVWKDYMKLRNSRLLLTEAILREYTVSTVDEKLTKDLSFERIEELISSEIELEKHLNSTLWLNLKKSSDLFPIDIANLTEEQKRNKIDNLLPSNLREEVEWILFDISRGRIVDSDIRTLFKTNLFDLEQKKLFIKTFIPTLTLEKLVELKIYTKEEANEKKELLLKETFKNEFDDISTIIESIALSDIQVSTSDLDLNEESIFSLSQKIWFKNLENNFNEVNEKIKEEIKNEWPQSISALIKELEKNNTNSKFKNLDKFSKSNIIKFLVKDEKWNKKPIFIRIKEIDDENKLLKLEEIWSDNIINLSASWNEKEVSFLDFLDIWKKSNIELDFLTTLEIKWKINSKNDDLTTSELIQYNWDDLLDEELKEKYKRSYFENKQKELDELKEKDTAGLANSIEKENIVKYENEINSNVVSDEDLLSFLNIDSLIRWLDEIDSEWKKLWLYKWLLLEAADWWVHEIIGINQFDTEKTIDVMTNWQKVSLSYEKFFQTFKKLETKRAKKINNFSEIIDLFKINDNKNWKDLSFENWSIVSSDSEKKWKKLEYFVSGNEDDIFRIKEISWDKITLQFWERKIDKDTGSENILIEWSDEVTFTLNEFKNSILWDKKYKFRPDFSVWNKKEKTDKWNNNFKSSLVTRIFNASSVADILAWWKMLLDSITETLKKWNDLKAARAALAMWKFLPEELRAELQIKVEREEADSMDKALDWLWKVDSPIAVGRIKDWLQDKNTPEYKKEAWLMFMLSKYWHLCAKWALYEYRGKFFWYEAFGWKIWDELYKEIKKEALDWWITFSEEYLLHMLLKKQCKSEPYNGIKRRSRLHKEYEWKWAAGINEEFEKWYKDAGKKRKADAMVKWGMDEATWWTTSNAIWWFKKAVERWWTLEDMSEGFFCLLYSGAIYNLDQKTFLQIKWLWDGEGMPIVMTRFCSTIPEMKIFNNTVLELSKEIQKAYWNKFPKIAQRAESLFNDAHSWKWDEKDRLKRAQEFWKDYGKVLSRALNMSNTDDITYSKTDKIVFLKKEENLILWEYYKQIRNKTTEGNIFKKDFMDDACWDAWVSWLNVWKIVSKYFSKNPGWWFHEKEVAPKMWLEISNDIKKTKDKIFSDDPILDEKYKKTYLRQILRELVSSIIDLSWSRPEVLDSYNLLTTETWIDFNDWWLNLKDFSKLSPWLILDDWKWDKILDKVVDNILSWRKAEVIEKWVFDSILNDVKSRVNENAS